MLLAAGIEPPVKVTVVMPEVSVVAVTCPPHWGLTMGPETPTPLGNLSMSVSIVARPLMFGLDSVMVRVETPPTSIATGRKTLPSVGGRSASGSGLTVKVALAGRSVAAFVSHQGAGVQRVEVSSRGRRSHVHCHRTLAGRGAAAAGIEPPVKVTVVMPKVSVVAVTCPPHWGLTMGPETPTPLGNLSMSVSVVARPLVFGLDSVMVRVETSPTSMAAGMKPLPSVGAAGTGNGLHTAEMVLLSIVTAPFRARALPDTFAPVVRVMLVSARILPMNLVLVPRVAELPTCQNTLQELTAIDHGNRRVARRREGAPYPEHPDRIGVALGVESKCSRQPSRGRITIDTRHECHSTEIRTQTEFASLVFQINIRGGGTILSRLSRTRPRITCMYRSDHISPEESQ